MKQRLVSAFLAGVAIAIATAVAFAGATSVSTRPEPGSSLGRWPSYAVDHPTVSGAGDCRADDRRRPRRRAKSLGRCAAALIDSTSSGHQERLAGDYEAVVGEVRSGDVGRGAADRRELVGGSSP